MSNIKVFRNYEPHLWQAIQTEKWRGKHPYHALFPQPCSHKPETLPFSKPKAIGYTMVSTSTEWIEKDIMSF